MELAITHIEEVRHGVDGYELRSSIRDPGGCDLCFPTDPVIPEMSARYIRQGRLLGCFAYKNVLVCRFTPDVLIDERECFMNCLKKAVQVVQKKVEVSP